MGINIIDVLGDMVQGSFYGDDLEHSGETH
jgi:hypothetical protein